MAAILRQQFLVDPRVRGTITLYSEEPLTPNEAYLNFLAALRGLGFTVVEVGGIFKVVPEADAKLQAGTVSVDGVSRRGDQVITQIFRLNHENANNLVPVLRPLITPNNTINANPGNNTLVITDYADNLQRLAQIIATMDTPASRRRRGDPAALCGRLRHPAAAAAPERQRPDLAAPAARRRQNLGTAAPSILVDSRSNSLIVRSANPSKMASVRSLIAKLDLPPQGSAASGNVWVVHLKNADATKLAQVLRAAFSAGSGTGGATARHRRDDDGAAVNSGRHGGHRRRRRHLVGGGGADQRLRGTFHRRLHPGRPVDQFADHHRPRAALPAGARHDRQARRAPRPGLHREPDRRGVRRQHRRVRLPVAGRDRRQGRLQHRHRRHQLRQHRQPAVDRPVAGRQRHADDQSRPGPQHRPGEATSSAPTAWRRSPISCSRRPTPTSCRRRTW